MPDPTYKSARFYRVHRSNDLHVTIFEEVAPTDPMTQTFPPEPFQSGRIGAYDDRHTPQIVRLVRQFVTERFPGRGLPLADEDIRAVRALLASHGFNPKYEELAPIPNDVTLEDGVSERTFAMGSLSIGPSGENKLPSSDLVGEVNEIKVRLGSNPNGEDIGTLEFRLNHPNQMAGTLLEALVAEDGTITADTPTRACRIEIDAFDADGRAVIIVGTNLEMFSHSLSATAGRSTNLGASNPIEFGFGGKKGDDLEPITIT